MKASDIISRVRTIAGDIAVNQFTDQNIIDWINDAQRECVTDNLLLQKTATQNTINGTAGYTLPPDILKLHSIKYDNSKLRVVTQEEFDESWSDDGTIKGTPTIANLWAGTLNLYPTPDSVKQLQILYIRSPVDTSIANQGNELELPVLYHRRIVDYCLAMVAEQDDDMARYQAKMQEFKTGVANIKDHPESTVDLYPSISVDVRDMGDGGYFYD